jgi:protocadherin-16/23
LAKDKGTPPLSSTALVVIQVGEVPPSNRLRFQEVSYAATLPENSVPGKEVAQVINQARRSSFLWLRLRVKEPRITLSPSLLQVTALRSDGRRQRILYSLVGGNEEAIFEMVPTTGEVRVRNQTLLDRELRSSHILVISAKTEGPAPLYAHAVLNVSLTDENDSTPKFTQTSYTAAVWEGNSKGAFVTQVVATDADEGPNASLIYYIVDGNEDNAFIIEPPFSGIVKTNIVLDREIQDVYRLTIIATDEGSPQMTGTCLLQINVIDINDNIPTLQPISDISISESVPVGTLVSTMVANDVDTNPSLVYAFTEGGNPNEMFFIGKYSGRVTLAQPLDFEGESVHSVQIQVSDSVHTAYTNLTVNILDSNGK